MATLYANFLAGTTTDNPLSDSATTINSAGFANLPEVTGTDIIWLVLDPDASAGAPEIVKVTAHTASATSVTVVRAQQSTTARSHATGTEWNLAATKSDFDSFVVSPAQTADIDDDAVTTAKILDANVTKAKLASDVATLNLAGYSETVDDKGNVSGTVTLNWGTHNVWVINPTGNVTIAFSNLPSSGFGKAGTLIVENDTYTVSWPAGTKYTEGVAPALDGETWISIVAIDTTVAVGGSWFGVATA